MSNIVEFYSRITAVSANGVAMLDGDMTLNTPLQLPQSAAAASAATLAAAHHQIDASTRQVRTATVTTGELLHILVRIVPFF